MANVDIVAGPTVISDTGATEVHINVDDPITREDIVGPTAPAANGGLGGGPIRKPDGENQRPGRGGYTLAHVVHWDAKTFKAIEVRDAYEIRDVALNGSM